MDIIINVVMIICFLSSLFWIVSDVTGGAYFKIIVKFMGVIGVAFPIIYLLKLCEVL